MLPESVFSGMRYVKHNDRGASKVDAVLARVDAEHKHPKGTKYTPAELREHRDEWYTKVGGSPIVAYSGKSAELDGAVFQQLKSILPWDDAIAFVRDHNFAGFSFQRTKLGEFDRFLDGCGDPAIRVY